jgi:hypothetical protein
MAGWRQPRAVEIDRKMREDFARRLKEGYGITSDTTDPILAVLFRTFAVQIEDIYKEAGDAIPAAVLDEMIAALGMPERRSRPAQFVVKLSLPSGEQLFESGTELIAEASQGHRLVFALDADIQVSTARLVFAGSYQGGQLRLLSGVELPEEFEKAKPSLEPAPAALGPMPALFLAIDLPDDGYLDRHGLYFELAPQSHVLSEALKREFWCFLDHAGAVTAEGLLRPRPGRCGIRQLCWLSDKQSDSADAMAEGFYSGRSFILPTFPPERRFRSPIPQKMDEAIHRIFGKATDSLFSRKRAWLKIGLPGCHSLSEEIIRTALHCVTASNLEVLNQTLYFNLTGTSVPVSSEGGTMKHLVVPISVIGESGTTYLMEAQPSADPSAGRFRFRNGRIEIKPAQLPHGSTDGFATVRLLVSDGALANSVAAGSIKTFASRGAAPGITVTNLTAAAGGTDGESAKHARERFAELLLCRDRVVTQSDLERVVKAFEPKISQVRIRPTLEHTRQGLRRIHRITVVVPKDLLLDVHEQSRVLQQEIQNHLQERVLIDLDVRVAVEWS